MKNVLITGGAGFIGRHLAAHLTRRGDVNVTVIDNESLGHRRVLDLNKVQFVHGDLRNRDDVRAALEGQDAVVHLAADTRVMDSIENPQHNFDSNVIGTFNLLEACRELGVNRVVAASTGGAILGDVEPPVHEGMAPRPTSPYGASKLMLEGYLSAYSSSFGVSGCALRFSNIYGPRSFHKGSVVAHFFKQILEENPLVVYGDGSQTRDYLYVGDLVQAIYAAVDSDVEGAYQLGSGRPTTLNELIAEMRVVTGLDLEVDYRDFRAGEVRDTWCQVDKARAGFGFDPSTPLRDGLQETWNWFRERPAKDSSGTSTPVRSNAGTSGPGTSGSGAEQAASSAPSTPRPTGILASYDEEARRIVAQVRPRTMTGAPKLVALVEATRHVVRHQVPGDIVECGVWRGGSMQAVALTLLSMGDTGRDLYLFDTFEGMPPPTDEDRRTTVDGTFSAEELLASADRDSSLRAVAGLDDVREGMVETGYPLEQVHLHPGLVEETTPGLAPDRIAILRLDTDWYASTKHELEHLYERLSPGGVLILDDYGDWDGARAAVDEWLAATGTQLFLAPMGGGRIAVKPLD